MTLTAARRRFLSGVLALMLTAGGFYTLFRAKTSDAPPTPSGGAARHLPEPRVREDAGQLLTVTVVRPKLNGAPLVRSVTQPAVVKPYSRVDLMSRVAGIVRSVNKVIGDRVKKDEILIEVDVPELVQELAHRQAMVVRAMRDLAAAEANVEAVSAAARQARVNIQEKQAAAERALSMMRSHATAYHRLKMLVEKGTVDPKLLDQRERDVESAEADYKGALAAASTAAARADVFAAKVQEAKADVRVKQADVEVAKAEVGKAKVMVEYAKVRAPFDGVVVARRVAPGAFVENAGTGQRDALLTVERTDKVKVVMWVLDRDAVLVSTRTEATIRLDALGGREINCRVSRTSEWLDPARSRALRVEVDLENPDGLLKAGMSGTMTLVLQRLERAHLLPASAVFVRGGQTYICEVGGGKAQLVRVKVLQEDGSRIAVVKLIPKGGHETEEDLTEVEQVVGTDQAEVRDGQALRATLIDW